MKPYRPRSGFSLVELSIVLVILGLLVGGVLTGKALIEAATIKSQISQLESFSVATRTFRDKYFYLPGDLPASLAAQGGFNARVNLPGQGNGDGLIEGTDQFNRHYGYFQSGENVLFWSDLSHASLIAGSYTLASYSTIPTILSASSSPGLADYLPEGKISGNYIFVTGGSQGGDGNFLQNGKSYFALQSIGEIVTNAVDFVGPPLALSVMQAYDIDVKLDDGKPFTGKIAALRQIYWFIQPNPIIASGGAAPATTTSCVDNNGNAANPVVYTLANANAKNCSLFFDMIN